MALDKQHLIVEVVGEPYLSRTAIYRAAYSAVHDAWLAWAVTQGGTPSSGYHAGLFFIGRGPTEPTQWRKTDRRGWACPKKGTPAADAMAKLPKKPRTWDMFPDWPFDLSYTSPEGHGSGALGFMFDGPRIGWIGDRVFVVLPDPVYAREEHMRENPNHTVHEPVASWVFPPSGLVRLTEAEYNFIIAEHDLQAEKAKAHGNKIHKLSAV